MSTYRFTRAQRFAVWTVNGEKCWLCDKPLPFSEAVVDHVIPEALEGDPTLPDVLKNLGRSQDFDINSFENWASAHGSCNRKKSANATTAPIIAFILDDLAKRASKAAKIEADFASDRHINTAIARLLEAKSSNKLTIEHMAAIRSVMEFQYIHRAPEIKSAPVHLTPGLTIIAEDANFYFLQGSTALRGVRPKGEVLDSSWDCPRCGPTGWNGSRCIRCGMLDDGD